MTTVIRGSILRTAAPFGLAMLFLLSLSVFANAQTITAGNVVKGIREVVSAATGTPEIEFELYSPTPFPIRDQIIVLRIGRIDVLKSRSPEDGSLNTLIFSLPTDQFEQLADGAEMTVQFGRTPAARGPRWNFGQLNKALLSR
jgi:hypothetical protein